jgi:hypothetical protein
VDTGEALASPQNWIKRVPREVNSLHTDPRRAVPDFRLAVAPFGIVPVAPPRRPPVGDWRVLARH